MIKISVCMIVKDEEKNLEGCLSCLKDIADEILIADTGSTDRTKEIAKKYTEHVYDFKWTGSFSDARNYIFEKATGDYIYSADADERLDEENIKRFLQLKEVLLPEVEIVQMYYCNQLEHNTIYSFDKEYRPKLYKRLRQFVWQEKIHEAINLKPVIFDSDIEIIHKPHGPHADRDLRAFESMVANGETMSKRLLEIYAKELFIAGAQENIRKAGEYFACVADDEAYAEDMDMIKRACCVAARYYRYEQNISAFFKYALRVIACDGCSEMCYEIGSYYMENKDYTEAAMWFYNAVYETQPVLSIAYQQNISLEQLAQTYELMGDKTSAEEYRQKIII